MMKALVALLGLIAATLLSGEAAVTVRIRGYNATGELDLNGNVFARRDVFTMGTRVLLTCDVTGLPEGSEVVSYRWFHNCTGGNHGRCQIHNSDPYYRVVDDTLLVDVTSSDQGGRYYCFVKFSNMLPLSGHSISNITVAGNPVPFLYTPTSLLLEHSVLTDVQQATGRNGQQWIKCTNGKAGGSAVIHGSVPMDPTHNSMDQTATLMLNPQNLPQNGHYYCLADGRKYNFNLFLKKQNNLPTPSVRTISTGEWHIPSTDGSQVEGYIVEFECSVRNITFVEKYMSVSASGGTGRVATNVSCFGGLGQLYRVKVQSVSGTSISQARTCLILDGQCRGEEYVPTTSSLKLPDATSTSGREEGLTPKTSSLKIQDSTSSGGSEEGFIPTTSFLELPGATSTVCNTSAQCPDSFSPPVVVAVITAASTLLLLTSLATFIGSCAVLLRAKRGRQVQDKNHFTEHANHIYDVVDNEVIAQMVKADNNAVPVYADVDAAPLPTQSQYQELQMHTAENHQYTTVTNSQ